jgi:aldehyde:ferredoxin oxidoreductase
VNALNDAERSSTPSVSPWAEEKLRRLYKEAYGKELTIEEAREMAQRLLAL